MKNLILILAFGIGQTTIAPKTTIAPNTTIAANSNPCGALPFTDSFAGSGPLSSCWTAVTNGGLGPLAQSSGTATCATAAGCISVVTGLTFPANESIQAVITPSGGYGLWCIQMTTGGTGPCFVSNYFSLNALYGFVNGVLTTSLASCSVPASTGDTIKISNSGTTFTVSDVTSSTTLCSATVTASGSPAIGLYNNNGSIGPVTAD